MIQNTQKHVKFLQTNSVVEQDVKNGDFQDSMKIRNISYDLKNVSTASSIHKVEENPALIIVGQLRDITNNKAIDGFAVNGNNSHFLTGNIKKSSALLMQSKDRILQAESTFYWTEKDVNGEPILKTYTEMSNAIKIFGNQSVVKTTIVQDPDTIKNPERTHIVVVYNRDHRVGDDFDYNFSSVVSGDTVNIYLPFKGQVTLNEGFKPIKIVNNENFQLQIEHKNHGVTKFNTAWWEHVEWKIEGDTIKWKFPDNWKTWLPKNKFTEGIGFDFYCEMELMVEFMGQKFPIPIVIQSDGEESSDPSYKKIKPIDIWWGCLGKNTKIRMADGTDKLIQSIQIGEKIKNHNNEIVTIKDIITGYEKEIILLETNRGNSILVTEDHPVLTTAGMLLAKNLNAAHILVMEYGNDEIRSLYRKEYNDTVYSLSFEKETTLIAEGFIVGDFASQQTAMSKLYENKVEKKLEPFQEELAALTNELNKQLTIED